MTGPRAETCKRDSRVDMDRDDAVLAPRDGERLINSIVGPRPIAWGDES
jgi:hypothetical protein